MKKPDNQSELFSYYFKESKEKEEKIKRMQEITASNLLLAKEASFTKRACW